MSDILLRPMRPRPIAGIRGPFLPKGRVGREAGIVTGTLASVVQIFLWNSLLQNKVATYIQNLLGIIPIL